MSAVTVNPALDAPEVRRRPQLRLVRAELLKLRRRRGLVALCALLTVAPMIVGYAILAVLHATDAAGHGPAGGIDNLAGSLDLLAGLGMIAALLVGTTAGAGDLSAGVFRELVTTGRSRRDLFLARIPAGLALVSVLALGGVAVAAAASVIFAGSLAAPGAVLIAKSAVWVLAYVAFGFVLGLGVSSLVGSRAASIAGLLAFILAISPLLMAADFLGAARGVLPVAALGRLEPAGLGADVPLHMSLGAALASVAGWVVVALALGAWRTLTRDA
jgi:hypothetical protein